MSDNLRRYCDIHQGLQRRCARPVSSRFSPLLRATAILCASVTAGAWLLATPARAEQIKEYVKANTIHFAPELKKGLTQCLTPAQWKAVEARRAKETAEKLAHKPAVRLLSDKEANTIRGKGPYRNAYFAGTMPWHRSLRDANLCNGVKFRPKSARDFRPSSATVCGQGEPFPSGGERSGIAVLHGGGRSRFCHRRAPFRPITLATDHQHLRAIRQAI